MTRFVPTFPSRSLLLTSLALLGGSAACQPLDADEYRKGIPNQKTVEVRVPERTSQALTVETGSQPLLAEKAEFYTLTREVSKNVNGSVVFLLTLVREVVRYPASQIDETSSTATWGPWSEALSPNAWRVTVQKLGDTEYRYEFEGKAKTAPDSAFITVLSGTHHPSLDADERPIEGFGEGNLVLNFDAAQALPEHEDDVGVIAISYSRRSPAVTAHISADFKQVKDDEKPGRRIDADYLYVENTDGSGELDFTGDADPAGVEPGEPAKFTVKSRWLATGAGRSDVKATGGDLPADTEVTANECWDAGFGSTYRDVNWAPADSWGDASTCVFADAVYSTLKL